MPYSFGYTIIANYCFNVHKLASTVNFTVFFESQVIPAAYGISVVVRFRLVLVCSFHKYLLQCRHYTLSSMHKMITWISILLNIIQTNNKTLWIILTFTFICFFVAILENINKLPWITEADYIINAPLVVKNMNVDVSSQSTHVRSLHIVAINHKSNFGLFVDSNNSSTLLYTLSIPQCIITKFQDNYH